MWHLVADTGKGPSTGEGAPGPLGQSWARGVGETREVQAESPGGDAEQTGGWGWGRSRRHRDPGQARNARPHWRSGKRLRPLVPFLSGRIPAEPVNTGLLPTQVATDTPQGQGTLASRPWEPGSLEQQPRACVPLARPRLCGLGALRFERDKLLGLNCVPLIHMLKPSACVAVCGHRAAKTGTEVRWVTNVQASSDVTSVLARDIREARRQRAT